MTNSPDPDQLASEESNWSGSILFAKAGRIRVHQDHGQEKTHGLFAQVFASSSTCLRHHDIE